MMKTLGEYVILDVRTLQEFYEKRIEGALLIPHTEVEKRAEAELPDKDTVIFVYCHAGIRSKYAAKILADKGYTKVFDMGAITSWSYETVSGT